MKLLINVFSLTIILISCQPQHVVSDVQLYDAPHTMTSSNRMDVFANNEEVFVYETRVNHQHTWSWNTPETTDPLVIFDFNGNVNVTIELPFDVQMVEIKPLKHHIDATINDSTVSFVLTEPGNYVIEFNQNEKQVLHMFTQRINRDQPNPSDDLENMVYFGPGEHDIGVYEVTSGQTIYISGGAVIHGKFFGYDVNNVSIKGRGIITGETYDRSESQAFVPIEFQHSNNIMIEGIHIFDPAGWAIHSYFNTDVRITNISIITARQNGDGISLQSNQRVYVSDSFVRSWDDSLVVKNYDLGVSSDILFERMVIWTDLAQSMEVGYETYGEYITNVTFKDIIVIYNFHKAVISIHNGDQAHISNITFENITVEKAMMVGDNTLLNDDDLLIDICIVYNDLWSTSNERGHISDITIKNVEVLEGIPHLKINISGFDDTHMIQHVTLSNIVVNGEDFPFDDMNLFITKFVHHLYY